MRCPVCSEEFTPKRSDAKTCGKGSCQKTLQRKEKAEALKKELGTQAPQGVSAEPEKAPEVPPPPTEKEHGHYIGKAPHKPTWSTCTRVDCAQAENTVFDWEPTCTLNCCKY